ncbi:DNA-directed RNA polymerase subunit beta [Bacillus paralicheniformis]|nr:DNA-directed RNA polymerase subunit beta [Bacillus paralicheniformis]
MVLVLVVAAASLGAMFGFSLIGEGNAMDIFKRDTWQHIFDIMNGKE